MNRQASNSMGLGILLLLGGVALLGDPNCKCGCRTLAEHLIKTGFNLLTGPASKGT
jgi:hypothetical protein